MLKYTIITVTEVSCWGSSEHAEGYEIATQFIYITMMRTGLKMNRQHYNRMVLFA